MEGDQVQDRGRWHRAWEEMLRTRWSCARKGLPYVPSLQTAGPARWKGYEANKA